MNGDVKACFLFIFIEKFGDCFNRFVMACICRSKNYKDANSIFVEVFTDFTDIKTIFGFLLDRDNTSVDFEVTCEFPIIRHFPGREILKSNLGVGTHQDVGFGKIAA